MGFWEGEGKPRTNVSPRLEFTSEESWQISCAVLLIVGINYSRAEGKADGGLEGGEGRDGSRPGKFPKCHLCTSALLSLKHHTR